MRSRPVLAPLVGSLLAAMLALGVPRPVGAQLAAGTVVDSATTAPLAGAVVEIARAEEPATSLRQGRVSPTGRFELLAPAAGRYIVTARAVGYAMARRTVALAVGETVRVDFGLVRNDVRLTGVRVAERNSCTPPDDAPAGGGSLQALWNDTWVALTASRLAAGGVVTAEGIMRYERDLDPRTHRIRSETRRVERGRAVEPFVAAPARELARGGFIRESADGSMEIFAPDAATITAPDFIRRHCFAVVTPQGRDESGNVIPSRAGHLALRFWPRGDFAARGVDGTFWLDSASRELREITFTYPALAGIGSAADSLGGRVRFARDGDGGWYVDEWRLRFPALRRERRPLTWKGEHVVNEGRDSIVAIDERGGIVMHGAHDRTLGALAGTVRGIDGAPVADADVELLATGLSARTDSSGAFTIAPLVPGRYALRIVALGSDTASALLDRRDVPVRDAEHVALDVKATPWSDVARASCNKRDTGSKEWMVLLGVVRSAAGRPARGARVDARWLRFDIERGASVSQRSLLAEITTDSAGSFRLCALPPRASISFRGPAPARDETSWSWPVQVGEQWSVVELSLDAQGNVAEVRGAPRSRAEQLALSAESPPPPRLAPVVVEAAAGVDTRDVTGFESRRAAGFGIFLTTADLEDKRSNGSLESAIRAKVNGFEFVPIYRGGMRSGFALASRRFRTMSGGRMAPCLAQVFVDGARINGMRGDAVDLEQLALGDIAGIEIYRGASDTPTQFGGPGAACGSMVIWTKRR